MHDKQKDTLGMFLELFPNRILLRYMITMTLTQGKQK